MRALIEKLASVLNGAMSSAEHLSLSDVKVIQKKGSVIHVTFKDCSTVEIVCVDDRYTLFNVEVVRKDDRSKMTHVSEETLMSVVRDVMREVDANSDGSVEKAHKKGVTPSDKTTKVPKEPETEELPGTEDVDVDELMEALKPDAKLSKLTEKVEALDRKKHAIEESINEDIRLNKLFKGDKDAVAHFKEAKSKKRVTEAAKPVVTESKKTETTPVPQMTEHEKAKKDALEKNDLLKLTALCKGEDTIFKPSVGPDGKLRFTGDFRKMENRGV